MMTDFKLIGLQLEALIAEESDPLANAANFVALVHDSLHDVNWTGIYLLRQPDLVLGPFQGKPACTRIALGKGVCGTAAERNATQRIDDVHAFDGHIACDPASASELVVPIQAGNEVVGVFDIDSPVRARFTIEDQSGVEALCRTFEKSLGDNGLRELARR